MRVFFVLCLFLVGMSGSIQAESRPNIVWIFCDDHATQAISAYGSELIETPNIDRIADSGVLFRKAYVTNSICAPSRAVVLTGKYSHINGQRTNGDTFDGTQQTVSKLLQSAGYETALIGKWHLKSEPTGFDHWEVLLGQGPYYNPPMKTNGEVVNHEGYTTDIITDQTLRWLKEDRDPDKPFLLMTQHKAPHGRWEPALRHLGAFDDVEFPEPATLADNFEGRSEAPTVHEMGLLKHMGDKRLMLSYSSKFTPEQFEVFDGHFRPQNEEYLAADLTDQQRLSWHYQRYIRNYLCCVKAVDENVGRLLDYLDETGLAENTIVFYSSDQGFYLGEHGWFDKRWMYEESFRTPMIVRWPGQSPEGVENQEHLVSNLDVAQTWLEIAGVEAPGDLQGRSFAPLIRGEDVETWRDTLYYHYYESGGHGVPVHFGVSDGTYKLIRFRDEARNVDSWEFYDLEKDPQELKSEYDNPEYAGKIADLRDAIVRQQEELEIPADERLQN